MEITKDLEGKNASFAIVVGTQRHTYVFDSGLQGECPDDARQCTQDGALVDGFTRVQDGLHHVEWGCTYISKHNAQSDEQSQEAYSMMAGYWTFRIFSHITSLIKLKYYLFLIKELSL